MNVKNYAPGMIFFAKDTIIQSSAASHCYILLGNPKNESGSLARLQAMTITSMKGKDTKYEIPIKLSNGQVSYIVPYTIFPIDPNSIDFRNFRGMVQDNEFFTVNQFLRFLLALYSSINGILPMSNIEEAFCTYIKWFQESNPNAIEYRDVKPSEEYYKHKVLGRENNSVWSDGSIGNNMVFSDDVFKNLGIKKADEVLTGEVEETTESDKKLDKEKLSTKTTKKQPVKKPRKVPEGMVIGSHGKYVEMTSKDKREIKKIDDYPRTYADWSVKEYITFLSALDKFGCRRLLDLLERFNNPASVRYASDKVSSILDEKGIDYKQYYSGKVHIGGGGSKNSGNIVIPIEPYSNSTHMIIG